MADTRVLRQGETIDQVCRAVYGDESGFVEAVLDANPGLAALGPIPGLGTVVILPERPAIAVDAPAPVTLWS